MVAQYEQRWEDLHAAVSGQSATGVGMAPLEAEYYKDQVGARQRAAWELACQLRPAGASLCLRRLQVQPLPVPRATSFPATA